MDRTLTAELPEHLLERVRWHGEGEPDSGDFVLYWLRTAMRSEENPALDVARSLAAHWKVPLLVYQGLSEQYEFASDRHHTFILQGARDLQRQFARQGISYAFHLECPEDRRKHLLRLAQRASVVVTEEMPVDPPRRFLESLCQKLGKPVLCVDTACVVPMRLTSQAFTRAFQYREATEQQYAARVSRDWPVCDAATIPFPEAELPFQSVDFSEVSIAQQVARCDIDHAIGPVVDTVGGTEAGYRRWNDFRNRGLSGYAQKRNDALANGVSRLSPYLHYGMISSLRVAREAAWARAEKFLEELLIWREMAYSFCFHRSDHACWSALPSWARQSLASHASDPRPAQFSWEELARGQTGDRLWDAAQMSLLRLGELHNNVRMTWGKAILNWVGSPQQALQFMIDLNHRYALDGRDPASYGGLLWCLGQFDRPFRPEQPVFGAVRTRPTLVHAQRLDPQAYAQRVARPRFEPCPRVAVIGAGIAGLFAARTLSDHGLHVTVFEKSRGVGGRTATRRIDGQPCFDHGAQYFTVRDARFRRYVESWREQGLVAPWDSRFIGSLKDGRWTPGTGATERFVAVPTMNALCKHLGRDLAIVTQTRIGVLKQQDGRLQLLDEQGSEQGKFDRVVVSAPAAQTAELLAEFPGLAQPISQIEMKPCWATMATFAQPLTEQWYGAFVEGSFLSWAARNSSKPGRPTGNESLVLHAEQDWTAEHWERAAEEVAQEMLAEFWRVSGLSVRTPLHLQSHRWKYALAAEPSSQGCFFDAELGIAACGDWAAGSRMEGAFLSGMAAAGRILGTLTPAPSQALPEQLPLFD